MPRYKLTLEYDGTGLVGWQRQDTGESVQSHLEDALFKLCQERPETFAAGRTDAGVHALAMVAHVDLNKEFSEYNLRSGLNFHLAETPVIVVAAEQVPDDFHARFSAKQRSYIYRIVNRPSASVLRKNYAWHVYQPLNVETMQEAAKLLIGRHDFTSFRAADCQSKSAIKTLDSIDIKIAEHDEIHFTVTAKSFLYHMVRNLVGTLKLVGEGKWTVSDVQKALDAKNRSAAGPTAPAHGLYFLKVLY